MRCGRGVPFPFGPVQVGNPRLLGETQPFAARTVQFVQSVILAPRRGSEGKGGDEPGHRCNSLMKIWMSTGPATTRLTHSATAERISQAVRSRRREPAAPSDQAAETAFELAAAGTPGPLAAPPRRRSTYRSSLRRPSCRGHRAQSSATAESQATVDGSVPALCRRAPSFRRSRFPGEGPPGRTGGGRNRPASGILGLR